MIPTIDLAKEAGFVHSAVEAERLSVLAKKLAIAYEHYRYVTPEKITAFQTRLHETTMKGHDAYSRTYDTLKFTPIGVYAGVPPADVLQAVIEARKKEIFDSYEVAQIETVREIVDPIVFGLIAGCDDRFFIAQWGNDVSIDDLLQRGDG